MIPRMRINILRSVSDVIIMQIIRIGVNLRLFWHHYHASMNDTYALKFNNGICVGCGRQIQLYLEYFDEMRGLNSVIISA